MNIALAQIKLKPADYNFNLKNIISKIESTESEMIVFPQADATKLGSGDLASDEKCILRQIEMYEEIAAKKYQKLIVIGDVLIYNGEILESEDGFYNIKNTKIYVADNFYEDIDCDLYILTGLRHYSMNSTKDFIESINPKSDFIFVNSIGFSNCKVWAGQSFAKNKNGQLSAILPLCEEIVKQVNFAVFIPYVEGPIEEEIIKVTTFALKEYCENTGFKKVIFGLSGGIDSALTAVLATMALGAENVLGVLMPSIFSSQGSIDDSIKLAQNLGIKTEKHSITPMFDIFMEKIAHETLDTSDKENLAIENLQARLRAIILMYFSNRDSRLLLSTGNKSEAAMGYGTLYGDMAGGLNLLADLTKTNVYKVSNYINRNGEIIPQEILDKAPSAELRPNQTDQDSLPDYAILDDIIEMYIEKEMTSAEICEKYDKELVEDVIKKIYRSEFKRRQACLGVKLTQKSFFDGVNLPITQKIY